MATGVVKEVLGKVVGKLAAGAAEQEKQKKKASTANSSSLEQKAKQKRWTSMSHYRLDLLDKVAKGTHGYIKSLIYKNLLREK